MKLAVIPNRKYWYVFTAIYTAVAILAMILWGFKPSIDFTGGTLLEVRFDGTRPTSVAVREALAPLDLGSIVVQPADEANMLLRVPFLDKDQHDLVLKKLDELNGAAAIQEVRSETVGPSISSELRSKAFSSVALVILAIVLYITFAFRKVSKPVQSWKYGIAVVAALVHDVIVPAGAMAAFGHFLGYEIDTLFVVALLTILGFSVHDTIVTFDRVRENLIRNPRASFEQTVDDSINQTVTRSVNTSLTIVLSMLAVYFFGGETVKTFMLILIIGMVTGTFSSIFFASPLLVDFARWSATIPKRS